MAFTPYGYNPYYPPPMQDNLMQMRQQFQPPVQPSPAPQQGMIWVQGETGAKSYMVASGNTVPLWDSENQTIYIKSVDASGIPLCASLTTRSGRQHQRHLPQPRIWTMRHAVSWRH